MDFAREFMTKLDGKVSEEDMRIILRELEVFSGDYDIGAAGMLQSVSYIQKNRGIEQRNAQDIRSLLAGFFENFKKIGQ